MDNVVAYLIANKQPVVDQCRTGNTNRPCSKITEENVCSVYAFPSAKWRVGNCPMATNVVHTNKKKKERIGQQKQRKK